MYEIIVKSLRTDSTVVNVPHFEKYDSELVYLQDVKGNDQDSASVSILTFTQMALLMDVLLMHFLLLYWRYNSY